MKTTSLFTLLVACAAVMLTGCNKTGDESKVYTVSVISTDDNGTATADKKTAAQGETITLNASPDNGYSFKGWISEGITILPDTTTDQATFTMPAKNVIIMAEFAVTEYTVTVNSNDGGTAKSDMATAAEGATVTLTAEPHNGYSFLKWIVESGGITCSPNESANPATFIMPAGNVSIKVEFIAGVLINGIKWATSNVDAPGKFAANPEDIGMYYQWNRKIGWSSSNPLTNSEGGTVWDPSTPSGEKWETANDPCPSGWRVPTPAEYLNLCDAEKTVFEWEPSKGVNGLRFTDVTSGNSIFLPAAGHRQNSTAVLVNVNLRGYYWQANRFETTACYMFFSDDMDIRPNSSEYMTYGFSVRCVAK